MAECKSQTTQCNFYIVKSQSKKVQTCKEKNKKEPKKVTKSTFTQTSAKLPAASVFDPLGSNNDLGLEQNSTEVVCANASTQCHFEIKIPERKYDRACQIKPEISHKNTQTNETTCDTSENNTTVPACFLKELQDLIIATNYPLCYQIMTNVRGEANLLITHSSNLGLPGGDLHPIQVIVSENGNCTIIVPFMPVTTTNFVLQNVFMKDNFLEVLKRISGMNYAFCPGLISKTNGVLSSSTSIKVFTVPFERAQSIKCIVWYEKESSCSNVVQCNYCRLSASVLSQSRKRKLMLTPSKIQKRLKVNSNYSILKLTPQSRLSRLKSIKKARRTLTRKVSKLEQKIGKTDLYLNESQSTEMESMVHIINSEYGEEVNSALEGATNSKILKQIWERDSNLRNKRDSNLFLEDQAHCENGFKGNRWNPITLRIALAVYCRSPAAFKALGSFNLLKLPCIETLKRISKKFLNAPGESHQYIYEQSCKYKEFQNERRKLGLSVPTSEGVLIVDEVKVIEKIVWNSKNHEFQGFAMNSEEFPLLSDVFKNTCQTPSATQYVLQFLWRDMSCNFDVIAPYFTFSSSVTSEILEGCIMDVMCLLSAYSFNTMAIVCDGASDNLTTLKMTLGKKGAFRCTLEDSDTKFEILPVFMNPFRENRKVFLIICPSHEMKSMISALHSSRPNGSKNFQRKKCNFGWKQIQDIKKRDNGRFAVGKMRCVPHLLDSYIKRDPWTRLNVKPSKIMQQEDVLSELYSYAEGTEGTEKERQCVLECYRYLRACNKLFENGLLSSKKLCTINDPCVTSLMDGYTYFSDWLKEVLEENPEIKLASSFQKSFLSWQTWDLLRITVFGFKMLVEDFLTRYPGHFITPVRINGSAIESLFSQFKYATGSKLSGVNYSTARKAILTKCNINGGHSSNKGYRDLPLFIRESDI